MIAVAGLGSTVLPRAAHAAPVPASCYDLLSFDGLDARYTANHCASAFQQAGWGATAYHNTDARSASVRAAADGAFYAAGHALIDVDGAGNGTAAALLFESPGPGQNADGLLGDSFAAIDFEAINTICDDTGSCHTYSNPMLFYPWGDNPSQIKLNLAVLQSCQTAKTGSDFIDMTTQLYNAGAGTVVGFADNVGFAVNNPESGLYGSGWANRFFSDLAAGMTYSPAAVDASNAVGNANGYGSYVVKHGSGAPDSIYPPQYYTVSGAPPPLVSPTAARAPADTVVQTPAGAQRQGIAANGDVFQRDPSSGRLSEAIFAEQLAARGPQIVTEEQARATAAHYAVEQFPGLAKLTPRGTYLVDHGEFREYRVVWQARQGDAWLPTKVTAGINTATGKVAYYSATEQAIAVPTQSRISSAQAAASALAKSSVPEEKAVLSQPALTVVSDDGQNRLVWITEVTAKPHRGVSLPTYDVIWTDAQTGSSTVVARS